MNLGHFYMCAKYSNIFINKYLYIILLIILLLASRTTADLFQEIILEYVYLTIMHWFQKKEERWWNTLMQVAVPFFIAGCGTIGAGLVLGTVRVSNTIIFYL